MDETTAAPPPPGLLSSLRRFAATLVEAFRTRLQLASVELEEEVRSLLTAAAWVLAALFLLALGVLLGVLLVVAAFWDTHRLLVLGLLAGGFLSGGALILAVLAHRARNRPPFLSATLGELAKDRDVLRGGRG